MPFAVAAVMVPVPDVGQGLAWYRRAFPSATVVRVPPDDFTALEVGGVRIDVVRADDKLAPAAAGSVVYWRVDDFEAALQHLLSIAARLHRGPMDIEDGQRMCQVRDPWGNCIGLRGPSGAAVVPGGGLAGPRR